MGPRATRRFTRAIGDVVVRAEVEAFQHVRLEVACGHHQDRDLLVALAQLLQHRETVLLRQHDVEQHGVGLLLERHAQALLPVLRGEDVVALVAKIVGEPIEHAFFVFNDQDSLHGFFSRARTSTRCPRCGCRPKRAAIW
jgi:hypothetical protein